MDLVNFNTLILVTLGIGLLLVCYILSRLVKIFRKSGFKSAHYVYLISSVLPGYEIIKALLQDLPRLNRGLNAFFLCFWIVFLMYCLWKFFREQKKLKRE